MKSMVDIDVVIDGKYTEPKVTIYAKEKNDEVEKLIYALETASENAFPAIPAHSSEERLEMLSQRDIIRAYTQGRKVMVQTGEGHYTVRKSLSSLEEDLNPKRFIRISQSEIINFNKVKSFDINTVGTIGIEFDNGTRSWASRSRVKYVKALLKE